MNSPSRHSRLETGITFQHPTAFWAGTALVVTGVLAHFPSFLDAAGMGYRMRGMPMGGLMLTGMGMILVGLALAAYGLIPFGDAAHVEHHDTSDLHFQAMDSADLTRAHWGLLFILGVALIVDVMKPATLGFVVPGMKQEYGVTTQMVAMFPFTALTGTTIGSLLWGMLADRVGRRASILLASIIFMGTSICGFMPSFRWNLFMCFFMGLSAGGMLPIVYALMTESMPSKRRGWLVVLHGGMGTVGGYLVASGLSALLEPHFTWRILWFAGLPTGFLMLVLNRYIPESPRFLIDRGRIAEAERVMERYGVRLTRQARPSKPETAAGVPSGVPVRSRFGTLFRPPYRMHSITVGMYGLGWGLVNWGFLTFTPTILRERGLNAAGASKLLFWSALIAVPATVLVAYLYGMWSSKKSMILFSLITAASLVAFALIDPGAGGQRAGLVMPLMVLLLVGSGGVISMLSPYTAEVYPTALRGTGSGFAAGSSKIGGMLAPPLAALTLGVVPGFSLLGLVVAAPVTLSAIILAIAGVETRNRALEELTAAPRTRQPLTPLSASE
ncbi:MAG TPA: MFS transporter [Gemmatimonadaceae bacterium]|nr:MFS transporter [Gemmatimonadaceae bacterium]